MIRHRSKNKIMVYIWFTLFGFLQKKMLNNQILNKILGLHGKHFF